MKIIIILSAFMIPLCHFHANAQTFWKISGNETHENALHSGILYIPETNSIFISTYNMGVFRSIDFGTTWDHVLDLAKDQPLFSLFVSKNGTIFSGGNGRIYRSNTNGDKWEETLLNFSFIKSFTEDKNGHLYICSVDSGGILKSENGGTTWNDYSNGLPNKYVNNLIGDTNGNMFCSLITNGSEYGGFYYRDKIQNQWVKKEIKVKTGNTEYLVKVVEIKAMKTDTRGDIILSLDGVAANFQVSGLFKNTVSGAITATIWEQENWNDTTNSPFSLILDELFPASTGHLFGIRISNSPGIYAKMTYSNKWASRNEGVSMTSKVKGYFCETPDGTVYFTSEFSNKLFVTHESIPGKKYYTIRYRQLQPMKLFEFQTIRATSASGLKIAFKNMDDKTSIEGSKVRATGLGEAVLKAFTDGNDSTYYSDENISVTISKAENKIILEDPGVITEGDTPIYLHAHSYSGEEVFFKVIEGNASFIKNKLEYTSPGKILFIATEPGNGTYEEADTVWMELCINPKKPLISADMQSGTVVLSSSSKVNNYWYINNAFSGLTDETILPNTEGIYSLQVVADACFSEFSEPYHYSISTIEPVIGQSLSIYPIPFRDKLFIRKNTKDIDTQHMQYWVIDATGEVMFEGEYRGDLITLDLNNLHHGWYILKITLGQKSEYFKISKSR